MSTSERDAEQEALLASQGQRQRQRQRQQQQQQQDEQQNQDEQQQLISNYYRNLNLEHGKQSTSAKGTSSCQPAQFGGSGEGGGSSSSGGGGGNRFNYDKSGRQVRNGDLEDDGQHSGAGSEDQRNNRTTDGQTMMHILKANIGTGVLAMPLAFKNVGLWLGLVLVPIIGAICIHCMNILIESHNNLCDRFNYESLDYDQVAALGLACGPKWARRLAKRASVIVTIFLLLTQLGFCCVYILFTVENLQVACMNLFNLNYSLVTYLLVVFPIIGITSCTSNLKHLARISTLANILQLFGLALIFFDLLQFHTYSRDNIAAGTIKVEQGFSGDIATGLPLFFATAVYAFEGIGVVLPLVKEMQEPRRISGPSSVLNTSMTNVALLYMAMGFFGYAKYGQTVAGSITLNLPGATHNELVRLAFAIAIGLSYSLQFYVPWTIVWPVIDETLFYSYRPRKPRDKLKILSKLSAENQWAIGEVLLAESGRDSDAETKKFHQFSSASAQQQQQASPQQQQQQQQQHLQHLQSESGNQGFTGNSMASTLATSYSISMSTTTAASSARRRPLGSANLQHNSSAGMQQQQQQQQQQHYGAIASERAQNNEPRRRPRNRMDDLKPADSDSDSDLMPDVQWRPPPRSMRGKRKLVRYTVILLTVSFTFVAAALIPRLDLFISLIGALASSCLAIIFPAIIQLCTFWNYLEEEDENEDAEHDGQVGAGSGGHQVAEREQEQEQEEELCLCATTRQPEAPHSCGHCRSVDRRQRRRKGQWRRRLLWHLFALKNLFLLLFGVLGLITGSWVSMRQLGVATV